MSHSSQQQEEKARIVTEQQLKSIPVPKNLPPGCSMEDWNLMKKAEIESELGLTRIDNPNIRRVLHCKKKSIWRFIQTILSVQAWKKNSGSKNFCINFKLLFNLLGLVFLKKKQDFFSCKFNSNSFAARKAN